MKKYFILVFVTLFYISLTESLNAASRYPDIDQKLINLQKGFISDLESIAQLNIQKSIKQSGSMDLNLKIDTPEASGSVNMGIQKYTTIYDAKTKNTEVTYQGTIGFTVFGSNTDWDNYDEVLMQYKKLPYQFSATINFDASMIVTGDGEIFLKVSRLDAISSGDVKMKESFDFAMFFLDKYIGKMYKIPASLTQSNDIDPEFLRKNILSAFDILKTKPLFTIISKRGSTYNLNLNPSTIKSLGWSSSLKGKDILTYIPSENGGQIRFAERKNPKNNYLTLTEIDGKRNLDLVATDSSVKNGKLDMKISVSKDLVYISYTDKKFSFLFDWKNGKLNVTMADKQTSKYDISPRLNFAITGDLPIDGSKTNLIMYMNGKNIGSLTGKRGDNMGEYTLKLDIVMPMVNVIMGLSGKYIDTVGEYQVSPPTIYELLDY